MTMGRPVKWENSSEIKDIIENYFNNTQDEEITLTGLCIALDTNKQTIANYQEKEEFKHLIDMAKLRIENSYEKSLRRNGRTGDIFALKNFGWKDTQNQEIELTGNQNIILNHKPVSKIEKADE